MAIKDGAIALLTLAALLIVVPVILAAGCFVFAWDFIVTCWRSFWGLPQQRLQSDSECLADYE